MPMPTGKKINRRHWKALFEAADKRVHELEAEVERLRANGAGLDDMARIKAAAFAAGVEAVAKHI